MKLWASSASSWAISASILADSATTSVCGLPATASRPKAAGPWLSLAVSSSSALTITSSGFRERKV